MEKEKISIIVPVYKVEKYLPKCLNSILRQTYKNLEIILVDDGSPDSCGKICDAYAKKDSRIVVIHKENAGVAMARNDGIKAATGEYISFIDSDDWISKDAYETLYRGLKKNDADCAVGGCITVIDREGKLTPQKRRKNSFLGCKYSIDVMKHVLLNGSAIWNRLFKRKIFDDIRFPTGRINDDEVTVLRAYAKCKRVVFLERSTYFYRIRKDSITTSDFSLQKMDIYYNSRDNLGFVRRLSLDLVPSAEYKTYKALLYCYYHLRELSDDKTARRLRKVLHKEIQKSRRAAFRNPYVTPLMKLAFLVFSVL